jgi:RecA-family ATPase
MTEPMNAVPWSPPGADPSPANNDNGPAPSPVERLATVTPASWKDTETPEERWLAFNRIPGDDLTIYTGDGGAGKTETALMLCTHVAAGLCDWLGCVIETGAALFFSAEEPESKLRKRVDRIFRNHNIDPNSIDNLHLHFPDLEDTVLASADRDGRLKKTPLMDRLEKTIESIGPRLVVVDNVAAVFDGDAIARRQVRRFCAILRKIAQKHQTAIILLDHPSVRGMNDRSGTANSVDWRNSARSMMYLSISKDAPDERLLEITKNNDGVTGEKVKLRWNGVTFTIAAAGSTSPTRAKAEREVEELFLSLLDKRNAQRRHVHSKTAPGGAPSEFAKDPDAGSVKAEAFRVAMERLLSAGRIVKVDFGPPSRRRERLERASSV